MGDGLVLPFAPPRGTAGQRLTLGVRPEHLRVLPPDDASGLPAHLQATEPTGSETLMVASVAGRAVTVLARERLPARAGDPVRLLPDPAHVHWFDQAGQRIGTA